MIATAVGLALFAWGYAVAATSLYGAGRAGWQRVCERRARAARAGLELTEPAGERDSPGEARAIRALLLRPCAGSEVDLARALGSVATARCSAELACRIAVESPSDPAASVATAAAAALREAGLDAEVVFTGADAPNHKAAQIAAAVAREGRPFDAIVVADSDVDLGGFDLDSLLAPLFEETRAARSPHGRGRRSRGRSPGRGRAARPGAVWAPPVEAGAITAGGDRASQALLSASLHAFTLLGALDGGGLVGKLFAVRREAIEAVGGFGALERVLGEDMELARRLLDAGRSVRVAPAAARSLKTGRSWKDAVDRYARWLTVIRAQRPHLLASYPLLFCAAPLLLGASLLLAPIAPAPALATAALTLASRLLTAVAARRLAGFSFSLSASLVDAALADAVLAAAFARALATRSVTWRGRILTVSKGGRLELPAFR